MKKLFPYILNILFFLTIFVNSQNLYSFVNTHDEDDNIVSGYLMANRDYQLYRDIFSHHLPGAYLFSEQIERVFSPKNTAQSVFAHRGFVITWNFFCSTFLLFIFRTKFLWAIVMVELLRSIYLFSLFQAENLVVYPTVFLILNLFISSKSWPILLGLANGLIAILLAPLWPLVIISTTNFVWQNIHDKQRLTRFIMATFIPVIWALMRVDIGEFISQFFGYNTLTYAPLVIESPTKYLLKTFLSPAIVLFNLSFSTKIITSQLLVLFVFLFDIKGLVLKSG